MNGFYANTLASSLDSSFPSHLTRSSLSTFTTDVFTFKWESFFFAILSRFFGYISILLTPFLLNFVELFEDLTLEQSSALFADRTL